MVNLYKNIWHIIFAGWQSNFALMCSVTQSLCFLWRKSLLTGLVQTCVQSSKTRSSVNTFVCLSHPSSTTRLIEHLVTFCEDSVKMAFDTYSRANATKPYNLFPNSVNDYGKEPALLLLFLSPWISNVTPPSLSPCKNVWLGEYVRISIRRQQAFLSHQQNLPWRKK